jgi:cytoskeleton protein RodZ
MSELNATTPGRRLRTAREAKGLSTQTAADALHLDAWVIEALERGDYARLGPAVYARGHLKHYAAMLELPVPEVLEAYEPQATSAPAAPDRKAALDVRGGFRPHRAAPWMRLAAGLALFVVVAGGLALWQPWHGVDYFWRAERELKPASVAPNQASGTAAMTVPPATTKPAAITEPAGEAVRTELAGAPAAIDSKAAIGPKRERLSDGVTRAVPKSPAPSLPAGLAAAQPVAGTGTARLRLRFSADSWVDVRDAAGRRLFAGKGRANSVKSIAGEAPMKVYLGFASGVQLEVNNHAVAIGPQFMAGDVARFEAGADGVLRRDARTASGTHPRG